MSAVATLNRGEQHVVVAICGASGACYALSLLRHLLAAGCRVSLLTSAAGRQVLRLELEDLPLSWPDAPVQMQGELEEYFICGPEQLRCYAEDDFMAPVASGSAGGDAMVIVPASMGVVGRLAAGVSNTLIERAADVSLKERRRLIIVPRETPLHSIHLRNLLTLSEAGAMILPAMPAFYTRPCSLQDIADFIAARILDQLGIEHHLVPRWGEDEMLGGDSQKTINNHESRYTP
ncbi:MAG: UbiX family flavin prenyltransferase [Geobacteraceae bacterium]|nr:UbiX family flavin prenyltransferase [Geobacteraceae bacterium]